MKGVISKEEKLKQLENKKKDLQKKVEEDLTFQPKISETSEKLVIKIKKEYIKIIFFFIRLLRRDK